MVPAGAGAWFHQGVEWPVGAGEPVHQRVEVVPVVHQDRLGSVQLHLFPGHPERLDRGVGFRCRVVEPVGCPLIGAVEPAQVVRQRQLL